MRQVKDRIDHARGDQALWDLVEYDPVCWSVMQLRDLLNESFPSNIAKLSVQLTEMIMNETYDRLEVPR